MPIPFIVGAIGVAAAASALGFGAKKAYKNRETLSKAATTIAGTDNLLTARLNRIYDSIALQGDNGEAAALAQQYAQNTTKTVREQADEMINIWAARNGVESGDSVENHIILVQAIALLGHHDLMDSQTKAKVIKCVVATLATEKGKTFAKSAAGNALAKANIPFVGLATHAVGALTDFTSTQAIGRAAKAMFLPQEEGTEAAPDAAYKSEALDMPEATICCSQCGAELASNAKFCPACGTPTVSEKPAAAPEPEPLTNCPVCGAELAPGAKFCQQCGYPIKG